MSAPSIIYCEAIDSTTFKVSLTGLNAVVDKEEIRFDANKYNNEPGTWTVKANIKGYHQVIAEGLNGGSFSKIVAIDQYNYYTYNLTQILCYWTSNDGRFESQTFLEVPRHLSIPRSIDYPSSFNTLKLENFKISWESSYLVCTWESRSPVITYVLERSINGGSYVQIYEGTSHYYYDESLPSYKTNVQYRVKGEYEKTTSGYKNGSISTIYQNSPPNVPSSITVPSLKGGKTAVISWSTSTDSENNVSGYILERSINGGSYAQIYKGGSTSRTDTITKGWNTVSYRVKAYDTYSEYSEYRTSVTKTVSNNTPPVISGNDASLGLKTEGFSKSYALTDAEGGTITVVEKIDGVQKRSYSVSNPSNYTNYFTITQNEWIQILNGQHTLTVTATDSEGASAVRTWTFSKNETEIELTLENPLPADDMISKTIMSVARQLPVGAVFTVEVCNNGNDASPTWEDMTQAVKSEGKFFLTNKQKTTTEWGYNFRIKIQRNGTEGDCFIAGIGGNFE